MMRSVMESAGLTLWPMLSLVVFSLFTAGLIAWLFRGGSKGFYEDIARLALDEETKGGTHERQG